MKYRATRKCFYGMTMYFEGQIVDFSIAPDDELFERVDESTAVTLSASAPNPMGHSISQAEKSAMKQAGRPKQAGRS